MTQNISKHCHVCNFWYKHLWQIKVGLKWRSKAGQKNALLEWHLLSEFHPPSAYKMAYSWQSNFSEMCHPAEVCCRLCLASSISQPYIFLLEVCLRSSWVIPLKILLPVKYQSSSGDSSLLVIMGGHIPTICQIPLSISNICKQSPVFLYRSNSCNLLWSSSYWSG